MPVEMNLQFTPARRLVKAPRRASCPIGNPRASSSPAFHPCIVMEPAPLALKNSMKGAKPRGAEGRDAFAFSRAKHSSFCPGCLCGARVASRSREPALSEAEWESLCQPHTIPDPKLGYLPDWRSSNNLYTSYNGLSERRLHLLLLLSHPIPGASRSSPRVNSPI